MPLSSSSVPLVGWVGGPRFGGAQGVSGMLANPPTLVSNQLSSRPPWLGACVVFASPLGSFPSPSPPQDHLWSHQPSHPLPHPPHSVREILPWEEKEEPPACRCPCGDTQSALSLPLLKRASVFKAAPERPRRLAIGEEEEEDRKRNHGEIKGAGVPAVGLFGAGLWRRGDLVL